MAKKYDLDIPDYPAVDQIVEVGGNNQAAKSDKILSMAERQM